MEQLKFCKDCEHFYKASCTHPKNRKFDLVDGTESFIYTCHELRGNKDRDGELFFCGEVAHWFEQKKQAD